MTQKNSKAKRTADKRNSNSKLQLQGTSLNASLLQVSDPFPPSVSLKMRYAELLQITAGTAGVMGSDYKFRLNSVFDPYHPAGGHQAFGFDQMSPIYNKYRVDKASYKITFTTPTTTVDMICFCSVAPNENAIFAGSAITKGMEWSYASHGHLSYEGNRICTLSGNIDLAQVCGVTRAQYIADDAFSALVTTDPDQAIILDISVGNYAGISTTGCSVVIELEYQTTFFERKVVATS